VRSEKTLERLTVGQIELESSVFTHSISGPPPGLVGSIARVGLINPPLVRGRQIVCGYRRLTAVRELGWEEVDAWIIHEEALSPEGAAELALLDNLSHRGLNDAEKAVAITRFVRDLSVPRDRVIRQYLPLVGIRASAEALRRFVLVGTSARTVLDLLDRGRIGFGTACTLASLPQRDQETLGELLTRTRSGVSTSREIVGSMMDLAAREGRGVGQVAEDGWVATLLLRDFGSGKRVDKELVRELRLRRSPRRAGSRRAGLAAAGRWERRAGVRLDVPPGREGRPWSVRIAFRTIDELRAKVDRLARPSQLEELRRLMVDEP
jgi:hypothetical protein